MTLERTYKCGEEPCKATFTTAKHRNYHIQHVHYITPVRCSIEDCNRIFKPANLIRHINSVHLKIRECPKCGTSVLSSLLAHHKHYCSGGGPTYDCKHPDCDKTFASRGSRSIHQFSVHKEPVKCPHRNCQAQLKPKNLAVHLRDVHKRSRRCQKCGKRCLISDLPSHAKICSNERQKTFRCPIDDCGKLVYFRNLKRHVDNKHGDEPLMCPEAGCGRMIKPISLKQHQLEQHGKEKLTSQCWNCGKLLSRRYAQQHTETCSGQAERKYKCTVKNCLSAFTSAQARRSHVAAVHCAPVPCPYEKCQRYLKPTALKMHIDSVHLKITVDCPYCGEKVIKHAIFKHKRICREECKIAQDDKQGGEEQQQQNCQYEAREQ